MTDKWMCNTCGTRNSESDFNCSGCGSNYAKSIYAGMLKRRLEEKTGSGRTALEAIFRYARSHAKRRNMPYHLVEDAIANAMVRMMDKITEYDPTKSGGDFSRWAISFVRNELLNIARNDLSKNIVISVYLDEEDGDGILTSEGIPDPKSIDVEEDVEVSMQREILVSLLGEDVYKECVAAYAETGEKGWMQKAAKESNVTAMRISRAKDKARRIWRWKAKKET